MASGTADATPGAPAKIEARLDWGRYRLEVSDATGLISSTVFNAGYWADEGADSPEVLDVALDKPSYRIGDTARIKITTRMPGRALVAVLNSGLLTTQEIDVPAGGGEVPIRVGDAWNPGAYVTVMLYRPMDEKAKRMPGRALGLRWLAIDQAPRTLSVTIDAPEKVKSGGVLTVPVKLAGLAAGEEARVTVAATDVGILNLTRFETPKPDGWFFGQRRLGSEIRDLYGRLLDGMRAERGKLRSGGDGGGGMGMQGSPPVEATLALFSGIVQVGADGTAKVGIPASRLQWIGPSGRRGVERRQGRLGLQGRDRARSRRYDRLCATVPHARRRGAARAGAAQRRGPGGQLHGRGTVRARAWQPEPAGLRAHRIDRRRRAQSARPSSSSPARSA